MKMKKCRMKIRTEIINLAVISIMALCCAFVFRDFKSIAVKIKTDEWLLAKKIRYPL